MVDEDKLDMIHNAVAVGMAKEDAYALAALTPEEIQALDDDPFAQREIVSINKGLEFKLLTDMANVVHKQAIEGDHRAIAWSLEHLYPRYSNKPTQDLPQIHIHTTSQNDYDNVEIHEEE